jgi:hypothetical protein
MDTFAASWDMVEAYHTKPGRENKYTQDINFEK